MMGNSHTPYRYSKKAGRYISTTKTNNREYYYGILNEVGDFYFDPNSTYGKYVMKKLTPDLKLYRRLKLSIKELERNLFKAELSLSPQIIKKEEEVKMKYNLLIREKKRELAALNNKLYFLLFDRNRYILAIGLFAIIVFYFFRSYNIILRILFFNILFGLSNGAKERIEKSFEAKANSLIDKEQVFKPLKDFESALIGKTDNLKNEIASKKQSLKIYTNLITNKVDILLNDKYVNFILSEDFYNSTDWKKVREEVMRVNLNKCVICGSDNDLTVDHIKPRSKYPEKALDISNTQILCRACNSSKGNR